jgi:hypothetical protein
MPYIDRTYYDAYGGTSIPEAEFNTLARRASDIIDIVTMQRIGGDAGFAQLSASVQEAIKKATAAQTETLYLSGGIDSLVNGSPQSVTVGKFSYSSGTPIQTVAGMPLSPFVKEHLLYTGLLNRSVPIGREVRPLCR